MYIVTYCFAKYINDILTTMKSFQCDNLIKKYKHRTHLPAFLSKSSKFSFKRLLSNSDKTSTDGMKPFIS